MERTPSVAVLVSAGRHPVSGAPRACRGDAIAMALGRRLVGGALRVIHAGDSNNDALKDYLALGAIRLEVLCIPEGKDVLTTLADYVKGADLILTGSRAEQGAGSGLMPYLLAQALDRPMIGNVLDAQFDGRELAVQQFLPKGQRRSLAAPMPLVVSVHPLAPASLRYAHACRVAGHIDAIAVAPPALAPPPAAWSIDPSARRPLRLQAIDQKDGYARMTSLIQSQARGGVVAFEGTSVDKAQILLTYLREHRLVDF
jgi:electron transfer flavoprotein beta subunit